MMQKQTLLKGAKNKHCQMVQKQTLPDDAKTNTAKRGKNKYFPYKHIKYSIIEFDGFTGAYRL